MINKNTPQNHDFYLALFRAGIPLKDEWGPVECSQATNAWLHDSGAEDLEAVFQALKDFEKSTPDISSELKNAITLIRGEHAA
jgi:hypothetical protein